MYSVGGVIVLLQQKNHALVRMYRPAHLHFAPCFQSLIVSHDLSMKLLFQCQSYGYSTRPVFLMTTNTMKIIGRIRQNQALLNFNCINIYGFPSSIWTEFSKNFLDICNYPKHRVILCKYLQWRRIAMDHFKHQFWFSSN